jgi:hypothetical protein
MSGDFNFYFGMISVFMIGVLLVTDFPIIKTDKG